MAIGTLVLAGNESGMRFRIRQKISSYWQIICSCSIRRGCGVRGKSLKLGCPISGDALEPRTSQDDTAVSAVEEDSPTETMTWLQVSTRRVIYTYLHALVRSHGWNRLYIVSPWISDFGIDAGMTFGQLL